MAAIMERPSDTDDTSGLHRRSWQHRHEAAQCTVNHTTTANTRTNAAHTDAP
jgi:hypothetical protein